MVHVTVGYDAPASPLLLLWLDQGRDKSGPYDRYRKGLDEPYWKYT